MKNGKKITLATVKSFIKNNRENLFINVKRQFDGSVDGEVSKDGGYQPATETTANLENTLGIDGAWFVGSSRDYFKYIEQDGFEGINVYNCCGSFYLVIKVKPTEEVIVQAEDEDEDEIEVSVSMIIQSHLNDAIIEAGQLTPEFANQCQERLNYIKYLIHVFPNTDKKIQAKKTYEEYKLSK